MLAVVIYVVCLLLTVFHSPDAASYGCLAVIVLAEVLRIGQYGLQELKRNDLHLCGCWVSRRESLSLFYDQRSLILYLVDAAHADILYHIKVGEILLSEGHPEASLTYGGIVLDKRLQLLMMHQVRLTWAYLRICQRFMYLQGLRLYPLAILII